MNKVYIRCRFTLVELLIVVGIVAVLAGLVLPAVIGGIQQGRITQAKSDLSAIMMALKGVEGTYGKMVKSPYSFGGGTALTPTNDVISLTGNNYNAFIAELTVPGNSGFTSSSQLNINKRKIKFLEPKASFDPTASYSGQDSHLWRDPWGNPYVILINVTGEDLIEVPGSHHSKKIAARAAGYSFGPNGQNDGGGNANNCNNSAHKLHDDITTWD